MSSNNSQLQNIAWFMKYKPKSIDEYIFSDSAQESHVRRWLDAGLIDGNVLLYGPPGQGKTSLSHLLVNALTHSDYDRKVITSRSVSEIDQLRPWCQTAPAMSKKKIVYIEEFDKLSSTALTTMKDSLLENFQQSVTFICNTNNTAGIDPAVISRFNYRFHIATNKEKYLEKLRFILNSESIKYNDDILVNFVNENHTCGLRDLISKIHVSSKSNILDLSDPMITSLEDEIVDSTLRLFQKIPQIPRNSNRMSLLVDILNSPVSSEYAFIVETSKFNPDIDWKSVLLKLEGSVTYLPVKFNIAKYLDTIDSKKFPYIAYIGFLYESIKSIMELH